MDCSPAYTLSVVGGIGETTIYAIYLKEQSPVFYADGELPQYDIVLLNPPTITAQTMTCTAVIQNKGVGQEDLLTSATVVVGYGRDLWID